MSEEQPRGQHTVVEHVSGRVAEKAARVVAKGWTMGQLFSSWAEQS